MPNSGDKDYFASLKEWSRRKHQILEHYADTFTRIKKNLYCIDGFAGRGEYHDGNRGSPMLTADIAKHYLDEGRSYWLRCINVEKDPEHFDHLARVTTGYPGGIVTNYGPGDFGQYVQQILRQIDDCPALFFLDPFGIDGLEWGTLDPILARARRYTTELLINFNVRYVPRLAGHLTSQASAAHGKVELLTSVLGTDAWQHCVRTAPVNLPDAEVVPLGECIGQIYKTQLRRHFRYVYHYPVRSVADDLVRYHLIFATNHEKGVVVMNDILCNTEDQYQTERERLQAQPAEQLWLFEEARPLSREEIIEARGRNLRQAICETLQAAPLHSMPYLKLRAKLADQFFALVRKSSYSKELKALRADGLVTWGFATRLPDDNEEIAWCGIKTR